MFNIVAFMGPSGTGKSTLQCSLEWKKIITWTTRPARYGEEPSKAYHFTDEGTITQMDKAGLLLEITRYNGYYYATDLHSFDEVLRNNEYASIILDANGINKLKENFPGRVLVVGVNAPREDCETRLNVRGEDYVEMRLKSFTEEEKQMIELSDIIINNSIKNQERALEVISLIKSSIIQKGKNEYHI
jgi:guanylate kinase